MDGAGHRSGSNQSSVHRSGPDRVAKGTFRDWIDAAVNLCGSTLGLPRHSGKPRTALYAGMLSSSNLVDQCSVQVTVPGLIATKSCRLLLSKSGFNAFNSRKLAQNVLALLDGQLQ